MGIVETRPVGIGGLDLGVDSTISNRLILADGVRYLEDGAIHCRGGRTRAGLTFPDEGVGTPSSYTQTITHFKVQDRCRGVGAFYDQRIETRDTTGRVTTYVAQRLNFLTKSRDGRFYFNDELAGSTYVDGDGVFIDSETRAKILVHGDRAYIIDESTEPKVFQRRPLAEQTQYARVKYDIRRMGILWPTLDAQKPTVTTVGPAALPNGMYRIKIILENKNGAMSNPSLPTEISVSGASPAAYLLIDWTPLIAGFPVAPNAILKVRSYVSFVAEGSVQTEPSDYFFVKSQSLTADDDPADPDGSIRYTLSDHQAAAMKPLMPISQGAPPKLLDMVIVNQTPIAIPMPDTVYREVVEQETVTTTGAIGIGPRWWDQGRGLPNDRIIVGPRTKLVTRTTIKPVRIDSSYLMWGEPGETEYLENHLRIGRGSEICVGLAVLGKVAVVFTNVGIYTFDPLDPDLKQVPSKVGCLARDSIIETENGIVFMASDGLPRLFNGATVDELTTELLPIFDRDDYAGDYQRFDRAHAHEVNGTFAKRRVYMTYPVSNTPGQVPSKPQIDSGSRNLMVGDQSRGRTQWSVDKQSFDYVQWLGREGRILGVDVGGWFYFLEEGLVEEQPESAPSGGVNYGIIQFVCKLRKIPVGGFQVGDAYRIAIDADMQGEALSCTCTMDENPALQFTFAVTNTRRGQVISYLPATFWGRLLTVKFTGTPTVKRFGLYGVTLESDQREVV